MKNKKVKQMMADIFNGKWLNLGYPDGMDLYVFGGYYGKHKTSVPLHKIVSLTADQLKEVK
tara:strand:+ start:253 stop:435 length:183 start_codon:yes stop_codon:yes gene_type:complete